MHVSILKHSTTQGSSFGITGHAEQRMNSRGIKPEAVDAALKYGRMSYVRSATVYAIGRKEVVQCRRYGVDLSAHEGVQVVCGAYGGVLTVYRNNDFRGLHARRYPRRRPYRR